MRCREEEAMCICGLTQPLYMYQRRVRISTQVSRSTEKDRNKQDDRGRGATGDRNYNKNNTTRPQSRGHSSEYLLSRWWTSPDNEASRPERRVTANTPRTTGLLLFPISWSRPLGTMASFNAKIYSVLGMRCCCLGTGRRQKHVVSRSKMENPKAHRLWFTRGRPLPTKRIDIAVSVHN